MQRSRCSNNDHVPMIMFTVILGFPAVPLLILGALLARREYLAIRDTIDFIRGTRPPD